ncbi:MAG: hypothetical protein ABEJ57_00555 [Halobacteriaceae archaeon]
MSRDDRRRTAALLLAVRTGRALLLIVLGLAAIYAAVTPRPVTALFPGPFLAYLGDIATLDLGRVTQIHQPEWVEIATWNVYIPDPHVTSILANRLPSTTFLLAWTTVIGVGGGVLGALLVTSLTEEPPRPPATGVTAILVRVIPVYVLGEVLVALLNFSDRLFNFDWATLLVDTPPIIFGLRSFPDITTVTGLLAASKWAIVPAVAASTALLPTVYRITRRALGSAHSAAAATTMRRRGGATADRGQRRHTAVLWLLEALPTLLVVLPIAVLVAEVAVRNDTGLSRVAGAALLAGEPTLLAALFLLILGPALLADVLREPLVYLLTGTRRSDPRAQDRFAMPGARLREFRFDRPRLHAYVADRPTRVMARIRDNPAPALTWVVGAAVLLALQVGSLLDFAYAVTGVTTIPDAPTLISWTTIPDGAYPTPSGTAGSLFGLPQWAAWTLRLLVAETYLLALLAWTWIGIRIARVVYGDATTPIIGGPTLSTLTTHPRIPAAGAVALLIIAVGVFAPATAPAMADNPTASYSDQTVTYRDPVSGEIRTVSRIIVAGTQRPTGVENGTAGPLEYGRFDRFHPMGILLEPAPAATGGRTRDAFLPFVMRLQQLLITVGLVVGAALLIAVIATALAATNPVLDAIVARGATVLALIALPVGVAATRRTIGAAGFVRVGTTPTLPPSPVDPAVTWLDQSLLATRNLALAALLAAAVVLVARRYLHPDTTTDTPWHDRVALPLLAAAHYLGAAVIVVVLVVRLFTNIDPSAVLFFDVGVSLDLIWIDTALWYRNTVSIGVQLLLAAALTVLGDGLRSAAGTRADPTSDPRQEFEAGGDGT